MLHRSMVALLALAFCHVSNGLAVSKDDDPKQSAELLKAKWEAARATLEVVMERYQTGRGSDEEQIYVWSRRVLAAEIAIKTKKEDRKSAYAAHLDRMKRVEKIVKERVDAGKIPQDQLTAAMYYRIEAQMWLGQAKGGK